jgi:hypothetical protein
VDRRRAVFVCLALFLCFAPDRSDAEWGIRGAANEASRAGSVEHRTTVVEDGATGERVTLNTAFFANHQTTFEVIDQPAPPRGELADAMIRRKAIGGVNGGYFDPEDAPLGLRVSAGRVISPLRKAKLLTGVLVTSATHCDIVRATHFVMSAKVEAAVQCGPLLVEQGKPIAGLNNTRKARRTFAAVDGNGHSALGVSSPVSLAQLAKILILPDVAGNMNIRRGLNLDGGSSTAFWFAGENGEVSIPAQKTVRDFVAIVPRGNR